MQSQDSVSIQRRVPDVEDYIDILRRHRSWILGPLMAGLVIGVVAACLWPDTYISDAVVRVVPPQVPERFVQANVSSQLSERFTAMVASIQSRNTLTTIVQTYNLYPDARNSKPMEDIIEEMRKDIRISNVVPIAAGGNPHRNAVAFRVSFKYRNRFLAQRVTQDLVTRLIDENIRSRASQATQTTDFLSDKVDEAKKELDAVDKKIVDFRVRNAGQTPDQKALNIQQLNANEMRIASLQTSMSRVNQDKMMLEGDLRSLNDKIRAISVIPTVVHPSAQAKNERLMALDREIVLMETRLEALRERYHEKHLDVKRAEANLAILRRTREQLLAQDEQKPSDKQAAAQAQPKMSPAVTREVIDLQGQVAKIQAQIQGKDYELEELNKELAALNRAAKQYQARIESSPVNEQEYTQLMLERAAASKRYEELSVKMDASQIATDLEQRKQGEVLELLDPASIPPTPTEPNRVFIVSAGVLAGLVFGVMLAGAREMKDTSLKNLKDVRAYTQLMILGSIPLLENDLVIRRRRRLTWLAWSLATILSIVVISGSIYYYNFVTKV